MQLELFILSQIKFNIARYLKESLLVLMVCFDMLCQWFQKGLPSLDYKKFLRISLDLSICNRKLAKSSYKQYFAVNFLKQFQKNLNAH